MNIRSFYAGMSRRGKVAAAITALFLFYTIFGFLAAPLITKKVLISSISERLGRDAGVTQIRINPFTLSLTAKGFKIYDLGGEQFAGFEELYVNFQLSSVFRRAYTFEEIRLVLPDVHVKVLPDGSPNFSDLLASSDQSESESVEQGALPQVLIFHLSIEQGRFDFTDLSRPSLFATTFFPIQIALDDFSTRRDSDSPYAFTASMGKGESLDWEGSFSVNPLRSAGNFRISSIKGRSMWEYFEHLVQFEILEGAIDFAGQYTAELSGGASHFRLVDCELKLYDFEVAENGGADSVLSLPATSAAGIGIDFADRNATVTSVKSSDARLAMQLAPDGTFNYLKLFGSIGSEDEEQRISTEPEDALTEGWLIHIDEAIIENYAMAFEDSRLEEPVTMSLRSINANIKNINNQEGTQAALGLDLTLNESGRIAAEGAVGMFPPSADVALNVSEVALKPFNTYLRLAAALDVLEGKLNLNGRAKYRIAAAEGPLIHYEGGMIIEQFEAVSRLYSDDFLGWQSLAFNEMMLDVEPNTLRVSEIVSKEPFARVVIWPDGTVNLGNMLSTGNGKSTGTESAEPRSAMPVAIDTVRIENGSALFADLMIKPSFATGIHSLSGTIKGLSSESLARADVSLEGKVDEYAPARIVGQINPLSEDVYTDLEMQFKNIELASFTPYSGRFAGYTIEKGKLSLDLKYKISDSVLVGENKIILDQLTLGERVDSPDATNLPIGLAIALLRDRNGIIDIDLPVKGDLNDPEFSYGHLVFKALLNIIAKAVTSPFAMLGGLVGTDSEELSFVEFEFGSAQLSPNETAKLDKLAAALSERPMLRLEIEGAADTKYDRLALAEAKLLDQLKLAKAEESRPRRAKEAASLDEVMLSNEDFERLLLDAYVEKYEEDPQILLEAEPEPAAAQQGQASGIDQLSSEREQKPDGSGFIVVNVGQQFAKTMQNVIRYGPGGPSAREKVIENVDQSSDEFGAIIQKAQRRLAEDIPVEEIELRQLAQLRANQIKGYLIETGGIPNESVFIVDAKTDRVSGGHDLRVGLALAGR
jgi:hypothetical protein